MAVAARAPEITYLTLPETSSGGLASAGLNEVLTALPNYSALLVGCGLGSDPETSELVSNLLLTDGLNLPPTILDADALNILAAKEGWHRSISSQTVLTPHAGEMARLMGSELGIEGSERVDLGRNASKEWNTVIVFKGAYTVVAEPEGTAMISPFANPGMATAGTGDVLAGVIAGLLAQGLAPLNAAALGVFLHGSAGEAVRAELGEAGMIAGDLICELPQAIKSLLEV
jgi:NAD(P)H-hydrate epimerase